MDDHSLHFFFTSLAQATIVLEVTHLPTPSQLPHFALPQLVMASTDSSSALLPSHAESEVEVWRDHDTTICAYGYMGRGAYWLNFPGLATYRFTDLGDVTGFAHAVEQQVWIDDTYYRSVLPLVLQVRGYEVLHASAVLTEGGVVAFCATSETGKSTIAYGLAQRGYPEWSDDAVALGLINGVVTALPLPFRVRLRPTSAAFFRQQAMPATFDDLDNADFSHHCQPVPLACLWALRQIPPSSTADTVAVRQLESVQAFTAVLTHAYCFSLQHQERKRQMLQSYLTMVTKVPIFELCFQTGIERLPSVLDCIEQRIAAQLPAQVR